ncbi:hypothetical protein LPB86_13545 [Pedobacter sp. MC2016-14]|uniref:hypothetical protein n=1 Tax=Pedobacter sp. MC2016-14 TaxID=2897327 RepID=UPI001E2AF6D9|nr:hypothetical protein [Pedobacter sp. MC2016-14]MCD0489259.1 hypothetical protein [Pedobacter sp. MC2016-14]
MIEVSDEVARNWESSTKTKQRKAINALSNIIDEKEYANPMDIVLGSALPPYKEMLTHYNKVRESLPEYLNVVREGAKEAAKNGMNEEILKQILTEDD